MSKPLPSNPSFCIITPTEYVEQFASQSRTHLTLAHIVADSDKYADAYHDLSNRGDFVIMDCSAFELGQSYAPSQLLSLAGKCGADAVVLPDYPGQHRDVTIRAAEQHIDQFKTAGFKTFFCPQSERGDMEGWIECYKWAASNPNVDIIGMSILGIPNALPHIPPAYARVVMTQLLIDREVFAFDKFHHFLGLNAGPALEVPALLKMNALNTIDSSNPVWMAVLGHQYSTNTDSFLSVKKVHTPVDFDYPMTHDQFTLNRIQHNITLTLNLF